MNAPHHVSHNETVVEMLKADPDFTNECLAAALDEAELPGEQIALCHIAEAQGITAVAARAGIPRESLYRALSPKGNPTIKTFLAVIRGAGLDLDVSRDPMHA
jgi:probable addiction module antidote protein